MNILALASSLGPFMCFTFDHLLCPAPRAEQSCRDRTGEVLHGGRSTQEARSRTDSSGAARLHEVPAVVLVRRDRRALSTAAPAMPFTHRQCSWIQCCGATSCSTQFNYLSTCQAFLKKIYNFIVTINKVTLHLFLTYSWTNPKSTQPPLPLLWNLHYLVPTTSQKLPFKIKAEMKIKQKSYYLFFNVNYYCIVIFILLFYFKH